MERNLPIGRVSEIHNLVSLRSIFFKTVSKMFLKTVTLKQRKKEFSKEWEVSTTNEEIFIYTFVY